MKTEKIQKFVCLVHSAMLSSINDDVTWRCNQSPQILVDVSGETIDEAREKLNKYLKTPQAIRLFGKELTPMPGVVIKTLPENVVRSGCNWEWRFEIVLNSDELHLGRPRMPNPALLVGDGYPSN